MLSKKYKRIFVVLIAGILLFSLSACGGNQQEADEQGGDKPEEEKAEVEVVEVIELGVIQIVEHPSLDAARQGFLDVLAENGYQEGDNLKVDFQNAQGDMPTAQTIANKFVADNVDLVLAIATPTSQAMAGATEEIPILITAVTDPLSAGLVHDMARPGTNVTGTTDMAPVGEQVALLKEFKPGISRIGIIYNSSEANSVVQVELAEEAAQELGLEVVKAVASNSSEVLQAAQSLEGRVEGIYIPSDNTIVSALESVIQVAENNKLPVIVSEGDSVQRGGLATLGLDYYTLGRQTGYMALEVLAGSDPAEMAIQGQEDLNLIINKQAAEAMGVEVPQTLLDQANEIIE